MSIKNGASISYTLDAYDRIESVSSNWLPFAMANAGSRLTPISVIGKSLWSFISDGETASLSRKILNSVRTSSVSVIAPFRCDSPTTRRFMEMSVQPVSAGRIAIRTRMLRHEDRSHVGLPDGTPHASASFSKVCSWCKRLELADRGWLEIEAAISSTNSLNGAGASQAEHGICPECKTLVPSLFHADDRAAEKLADTDASGM